MTAREARNRRRAEERRQAKLTSKAAKSANGQPTAEPSITAAAPVARFNPELEDEFPRELQIEANLFRDRIHANAGLKAPNGFVSHGDAKASATPPADDAGFVSQNAPQSSKRAEINRLNAQYSTGPKSPEGKLASSRNSLKHGLASGQILIQDEDPSAFEELLHGLREEHQPASPTEELLVNEMAQSYWLAQRAIRFQNECFGENEIDEKRLALFLRYQTTYDRGFHKALTTLLKLKKERRGFVSQSRALSQEQTGFVPQNDTESSVTQATASGFVRKNTRDTAAEAA